MAAPSRRSRRGAHVRRRRPAHFPRPGAPPEHHAEPLTLAAESETSIATATTTVTATIGTATLDGIEGIDSNAIAIGTTAVVAGPQHRSKIVGRWAGKRR